MSMPFSSNSELPSGRSSFWHLRPRFAFSFNMTPQCHISHSEPNNAIWKRLKHSHNSTILSRNLTQLTQLNASYATHTTKCILRNSHNWTQLSRNSMHLTQPNTILVTRKKGCILRGGHLLHRCESSISPLALHTCALKIKKYKMNTKYNMILVAHVRLFIDSTISHIYVLLNCSVSSLSHMWTLSFES